MKKYSKQRELILKSLQARTDHPSAETLYIDLKKEMPEIGIATVYRNLVTLYQDNEIVRISGKDVERFDGNIKRHIHFICDKCKGIYDIFLPEKELKCLEKIVKNVSSNPENTWITISGLCKECKEE